MSHGNSTFTGIQIYEDDAGARQVNFFQNGMITPLEPNEKDMERALGFYDVDMNPVADPTTEAGKIDEVLRKLEDVERRIPNKL